MGKQFRFIMDKNDEEDFFKYVQQEGRIFKKKKKEGTVEIFDVPEHIWINMYFYKDIFGDLKYIEITDEMKCIETTASPVIEFRETIVRENVKEIQRGRLFVEMKYYNQEGDLVSKNALLDDWYKELKKWIRKKLVCVEVCTSGKKEKEYVSSSLVRFVEEGYQLLG